MTMRGLVHPAATLMLSALCLAEAPGESPQAQSESQGGAAQGTETSLPVRRVVLYKTGVGYFEHLGRVRDDRDVAIRFTSGQLNDVLKSLTALDLGGGRIAGISYNSVAPLAQRLDALRLPLGQNASLNDLLSALRGARVQVAAGGTSFTGRLLDVERRSETTSAGAATPVDVLSLITSNGDVRTVELTPAVRVRLLDADLRREVGQYLDLVGSTHEQDARRMVIQALGEGERELLVSYVSEVPVWKSTYRLVLPDDDRAPLLQGWAIVDNTIGEDWNDVTLSLVAGAPQTFVQQISQPYYTQRPVVPMPRNVLLTPQTHQATLASGPGVLRGVVRDNAGAPLPGVAVSVRGPKQLSTVTNERGEYSVEVPAGTYRLAYELSGFKTVVHDEIVLGGGVERRQDVSMQVGAMSETVEVAAAPFMSTDSVRNRGAYSGSRNRPPGGTLGGVVGGIPAPPPPPAAPLPPPAPAAQATDLGDLFEYRITEPVTIARNQSALVPIISAEVKVEKVSLWSRTSRAGRPLRAVWLTNSSGLTLDGGSFSVVEGDAFAGEGLIEPLAPGERRLVSYAADLAVLVGARAGDERGRVVRVRARDGIVTQHTEERSSWRYSVRNEDSAPRVVIIEHPIRSGWKLAPGITPAETTPSTYRFRVPIDPRRETSVEVREIRLGESSLALGDISDEQLVAWQQAGIDAAALETALRPVIAKKVELARFERRLERLGAERNTIAADQQRLRENMKALRGSREERELLRRYTTQLMQQEDRLAALEREIAAETAARDKANEELSALMAALSFDVDGSRI